MRDLKFCKCGKIIEKADKYCDKCRIEEEKKISEQKRHRNKMYDRYSRDKKSNAFYHSGAWVRLVNVIKIRESGLCLRCWSNNIMTAGRIVHHIIPVKDDWNKRLDPLNCVYLCDECHSLVHKEYAKSRQSKERMQRILAKMVKTDKSYLCATEGDP